MEYTETPAYLEEVIDDVQDFAQTNVWGLDACLTHEGYGDFTITVTLEDANGPKVAEFTQHDTFVNWINGLDDVPEDSMAEYLARLVK